MIWTKGARNFKVKTGPGHIALVHDTWVPTVGDPCMHVVESTTKIGLVHSHYKIKKIHTEKKTGHQVFEVYRPKGPSSKAWVKIIKPY